MKLEEMSLTQILTDDTQRRVKGHFLSHSLIQSFVARDFNARDTFKTCQRGRRSVCVAPPFLVAAPARLRHDEGKLGDDVRIVVKSGSYASSLMRKMLY